MHLVLGGALVEAHGLAVAEAGAVVELDEGAVGGGGDEGVVFVLFLEEDGFVLGGAGAGGAGEALVGGHVFGEVAAVDDEEDEGGDAEEDEDGEVDGDAGEVEDVVEGVVEVVVVEVFPFPFVEVGGGELDEEDDGPHGQDGVVYEVGDDEEYEEEEVHVIVVSYTVVDIRAVMIKPLHTQITYVAMPRPGRPYDLALRTHIQRRELIEQILKVNLGIPLRIPRIPKRSQRKEQDEKGSKTQEDDERNEELAMLGVLLPLGR